MCKITAKEVLGGIFIASDAYVKKDESFKYNDLSLKKLETEEQFKSRV